MLSYSFASHALFFFRNIIGAPDGGSAFRSLMYSLFLSLDSSVCFSLYVYSFFPSPQASSHTFLLFLSSRALSTLSDVDSSSLSLPASATLLTLFDVYSFFLLPQASAFLHAHSNLLSPLASSTLLTLIDVYSFFPLPRAPSLFYSYSFLLSPRALPNLFGAFFSFLWPQASSFLLSLFFACSISVSPRTTTESSIRLYASSLIP